MKRQNGMTQARSWFASPAENLCCIPDFYKIANLDTGKRISVGNDNQRIPVSTMLRPARWPKPVSGVFPVSLDGFAEDHDFSEKTGRVLSKWRFMESGSLQKCGKYRGILQVTTVVHRKNIGRLEEMYGYLKEMGITPWRLTNMDPIGARKTIRIFCLTGKDFLTLLSFIREKRFCITTQALDCPMGKNGAGSLFSLWCGNKHCRSAVQWGYLFLF